MQLSAQSIMSRCVGTARPMISPFSSERRVVNGKSWGLSAASYDVRIAHDLVLGPHPGYFVQQAFASLGTPLFELVTLQSRLAKLPSGVSLPEEARKFIKSVEYPMVQLADAISRMSNLPPCTALAHTIEDFIMPDNVSAQVCDKSSFARVFVSAFNTFFDPGFEGNATLELVNLSPDVVEIKAGDPICQLVFSFLDQPTDRPYRGKYQHQKKAAQPAIFELSGQGELDLVAAGKV
jgi:deoxycytidine triphosphate deaminase